MGLPELLRQMILDGVYYGQIGIGISATLLTTVDQK